MSVSEVEALWPARVALAGRWAWLLISVSLLVGVQAAVAARMEVEVVGVTDGDTLVVLNSNKAQHRVRLAGIDAPEKRQAFGTRAQEALASAVFRRSVVLEWHKKDRYGRLVGKVTLADRDVGLELLAAGLGWHYKAYEHEQGPADKTRYAAAEAQARRARRGLWSQPNPVPPWEFRASR